MQLSQYAQCLEAGTWNLEESWERTTVGYVEMAGWSRYEPLCCRGCLLRILKLPKRRYCVTLRRQRYAGSPSSSHLLTPTTRQQKKTSRSTTHAPANTGQKNIPLRQNLFCLRLLVPIHNCHHHSSSIPSSCTTFCAHHGRPHVPQVSQGRLLL